MNSSFRLPKFLNLEPHKGSQVELLIGIDVGTTFSGVSYAFLLPNEVPEVQAVSRFSDQVNSDAKIPSIMYFDKDGKFKAAGASAVSDSVEQEALFEGWTKVQHFKIHLRPKDMEINTNGLVLGKLPSSMTAVKAMGHYLRFLHKETIKYIEDHHSGASELLRDTGDRITFVLSHPNGWAGAPQNSMREAAIFAGLVPDTPAGRERIKFVTEGEASALACLANGLCPPNLKPGYRFIIADAGGGTIDIVTYEVVQTSPLRLREITSSDCRFAGSVFVNDRARELFKQKLLGTHFDNEELLDEIAYKKFEETTKREFKDSSEVKWMSLGDRSENDAGHGIRRGYLKLEGKEIERCFEFSLNELIASIRSQLTACANMSIPVWLVGGFGSSPWLLKKLREELGNDGIDVSCPDTNLAKAVANGDVFFALDKTVAARVTRATYGVECNTAYQSCNPEHVRRKHSKYKLSNGETVIPFRFDVIVDANVQVDESESFTRPYFRLVEASSEASFKSKLLSYVGPSSPPGWSDEDKESFRAVCTFEADLSNLCVPSSITRYNGRTFWKINYEFEIFFGQTELKARVKWIEKGVVKYGPATIIYEDQ